MQKIPTLFQRNYETDRLVRDEVTPGCEWVVAGEGVPTRKLDGTACLIKEGKLYKRYEVKKGRKLPVDFIPAQELDEVTGEVPGWIPVGEGPEDRYHREAFDLYLTLHAGDLDGTYELCGPKVQGNPERLLFHELIPHDPALLELRDAPPRDFEGLKEYLGVHDIEGVVWHHEGRRMCKIKKRDFGFKREDKKDEQGAI